MPNPSVHLISNAHLDPVWQWEWEEGAAAALSTFRAAADFCEEFDGYVFNHNEVILYKWVEEYEPALFSRIQKLVQAGKWHIMGGWYLQPDCNMPAGESFVRQILLGQSYFLEKFGVRPTTAINFDSFGHTPGLVQIMQQAGYDSYIFMRPEAFEGLPAQNFIWKGFNGSRVTAHQIKGGYGSALGKAEEKISQWLQDHQDTATGIIFWGVGNHGGGPSRVDIRSIAELQKKFAGTVNIIHSTPEQYFAELRQTTELQEYEGDLNPRFIGCYTSMIRIKQKHRQLENELLMTEKMLSSAAARQLVSYPSAELYEAWCDLLTAQFHDILPGTSIQPAEEASLRLLEHGLEIVSRLRARAFFALSSGQPKALSKQYPVMVYNPHPFKVRGLFACEFMLEDQNWLEGFSMPVVQQDGKRLPSQCEKEYSNLNLDWRKRIIFQAELAPMSMNRFDCSIEVWEQKPRPQLREQNGKLTFETEDLLVVVNAATGLIDEYAVHGQSVLQPGAFQPLFVADNADPWRMDVTAFPEAAGAFTLMDTVAGSRFSGSSDAKLPSVRVIEDGEVRTVIEALLQYGQSSICLTYRLPKKGTELEVELRVYWSEKDAMLKLAVPTVMKEGTYHGQTAYGINELMDNGDETVSQRWVAVQSEKMALTCINNGIYGSDYRDGEIRLSLLRGAGYCAHPIMDRPLTVQDRFLPRIDQGERSYTFWINAGDRSERLEAVDREATMHNEQPYALSFFPSGDGVKPDSFLILEDDVIQLGAFKKEERGEDYIIRLFEPTGQPHSTVLSLPSYGLRKEIHLEGFEIATLRLNTRNGTLGVAELCER